MRYRSNYIISVLAVAIMAGSCEKAEIPSIDGSKSDKSIVFDQIKVRFGTLTKASSEKDSRAVTFSDMPAGVSLTVNERVGDIGEGADTKAQETTTANLGGFNVYGYLDKEILSKPGLTDEDRTLVENNTPFINNRHVSKSSGTWSFDDADSFYWRYGTYHNFWAYTPNDIGFAMNSGDYTKSSFSNYVADGTEDVVVSYRAQHFGNETDSDSEKNPVLSLDFYHAMTAITVNSEDIKFYQKALDADGTHYLEPATDAQPGRCKILSYTLRKAYDKGNCSMTGANDKVSFAWSGLSKSSSTDPVLFDIPVDGSEVFLIPQQKDASVLNMVVVDTLRTLTRPYVFETNKLFGTGTWEAGKKYQYDFGGSFIVPKQDGKGINAEFSGKGFKFLSVTNQVGSKYIAEIKLEWEGITYGNEGNGTCAFMSVESAKTDASGNLLYVPEVDDYMADSNNPVTNNSHVGFIYNNKTHSMVSSTAEGISSGYTANADPKKAKCWCIIPIPEDDFDPDYGFNIYAVYNGGNNGDANWNMTNMSLTVTKWRNLD